MNDLNQQETLKDLSEMYLKSGVSAREFSKAFNTLGNTPCIEFDAIQRRFWVRIRREQQQLIADQTLTEFFFLGLGFSLLGLLAMALF